MNQLAESLIASSSRPVRLRVRADLEAERQVYQGCPYWVVKDPLALKYFRFEEEEYWLLQMLDGRRSIDDIRQQFEKEFAPQRISSRELQQLIGSLHRNALLLSNTAGQGDQLHHRGQTQGAQERRSAWSNVLAFRFKGFDPDRLLIWLDRRCGWIFSASAGVCSALLVLAALLLVATQFEVMQARLPGFGEFFAAKNWIWLALTLSITKVIHEFGHGLACKRFGGECHEMGVMLLVFTPCLYCNVSDSWMLPSKWRRAAVAAAGMYIELVLAATCTFVWWFTEPGMLNYLCLNVMFVSSVSTLAFNANPLLRYDGYYILSDLAEIPNLRQKASLILQHKAAFWLLGETEPYDPFLPRKGKLFFILFAIASFFYRWLIAVSILWFLHHALEPYGLQIIGQLAALMAAYGLLIQPLWSLHASLRTPGRMDALKAIRAATAGLVVVGIAAACLIAPLPHYVWCSVHLEPQDAAAAYVTVPGRLQHIHVRAGDYVSVGQPLATLESSEVQLKLLTLQGDRDQLLSQIRTLWRLAFTDENAGREIAEIEEAIDALNERIEHSRRDVQRLTIRATSAGVVLPPPSRAANRSDEGLLGGWSDAPLLEKNLGAYLQGGVELCSIGPPRQLEAVLAIDQSQIEFIEPGQPITLYLAPLPNEAFATRVAEVSRKEMSASPRALTEKAGGDLATRQDSAGREQPLSTTFQADAPLQDDTGLLFAGATGKARVFVGRTTLAQRLWRSLNSVINLEL